MNFRKPSLDVKSRVFHNRKNNKKLAVPGFSSQKVHMPGFGSQGPEEAKNVLCTQLGSKMMQKNMFLGRFGKLHPVGDPD